MAVYCVKSISFLLVLVVVLTPGRVACQVNNTTSLQNASWPFQSFQTANFHPPNLKVAKSGATAPGYLFFAPTGALEYDVAPLIMTDSNELIWQGPTGQAFNFGVHRYRDKPVLAYWNGTVFREPVGRGSGSIHILDHTYQEITVVSLYDGVFLTLNGASNTSNVDLHEIYVTDRNTVLVTANNVTQANLQSEIPFTASVYPLGSEGFDGTKQSKAWGYFHINAAKLYDGGYIVSSRYLCAAIALDGEGNVRWRLQHDIRAMNSSSTHVTLHMHDNANCPIDNGTTPSSGLTLDVNLVSHHVSLNKRYLNPKDPIYATAQGSFERPSDGHVFLGHGYQPKLEEFAPSGQIVMTVQFGPPGGVISYRAFRQTWVGRPSEPPVAVVKPEDGETAVYMSWNGATEYDTWIVYGGDSRGNLTILATQEK